ncbi:ComF family protein [Gloeobacter kilaueensis]|uniref:Phosphoribosyltransferase n=1 Tax=Gloeobacter kilaueensis (strain ATCC BAA-2537 / CCAP 1431/1 / ULC 316 / JS1) TaxID=1183438 RepID=U5QG26_GLOK1|nr:ComF family protein [Gloeobacter kilaueensis]AGY57871.1 phosphoribosyltransferase [Gloeobacter kilaueensis JS1]
MKFWLFQHRCPLCEQRTSDYLCARCGAELTSSRFEQRRTSTGSLAVYPWGVYAGLLRRALELLKYGNRPEIGDWLGERLGRWWLEERWPRHYRVIAVPLHAERLSERGYNQAERLARAFCRRTGMVHSSHLLQRTRATPALHRLDPIERARAIEDAFSVVGSLPPEPVLLVDDIFTTGGTLRQCAVALQQRGSGPVSAIVVARPLLYRQTDT